MYVFGLNSTYMDLVELEKLRADYEKELFKFHLHGFSHAFSRVFIYPVPKFKFHLHGFSPIDSIGGSVDCGAFKFHLHGFSLVRFSVLIFQRFLY